MLPLRVGFFFYIIINDIPSLMLMLILNTYVQNVTYTFDNTYN